MRYLRCGELIIDTLNSNVHKDSIELSLDPKLYDLLVYFCRHKGQTISRDELLQHVWAGSIVTDNAINKIVANLRKSLNDNPKKPEYIQTVPKKGYRLIANVEYSDLPFDQTHSTQNTESKSKSRGSFNYGLVSVLMISMMISFTALYFIKDEKQQGVSSSSLTRLAGQEYASLMAPSLNYLLFLKTNELTSAIELWKKDLKTNQSFKVHNSPAEIRSVFAIDDKESNFFFFQYLDYQCLIGKVSWQSEDTLSTAETLIECDSDWVSDAVYIAKQQKIIFTSNQTWFANSELTVFDIKSGTSDKFQPQALNGLSVYSLDVSPDQNKLVLLAMASDYKTKIFTYNLNNEELIQHREVNHFIRSAIWHHDNERLVLAAPYPSKDLLVVDLDGNDIQTLVSNSESINGYFERINNGYDYTFSTKLQDFNIRWLEGNEITYNSSVYDALPTLLHHQRQYVMSSHRSGKTQVFLADFNTDEVRQITNFSTYEIIDNLDVSPDDRSLLIIQHSKLSYIPLSSPTKEEPEVFYSTDKKIVNSEWLDNRWLAITEWDNNADAYQMFFLDVIKKRKITIDKKWCGAATDHHNVEDLYLLDCKANKLAITSLYSFINNEGVNVGNVTFLNSELPLHLRQLKIFKGVIYYHRYEHPNYYVGKININGDKNEYPIIDIYGYDVSKNGLIVAEKKTTEGDIHRTVTRTH